MNTLKLAGLLNAEIVTGSEEARLREVDGGYCGDLLSWVMGRAKPRSAWVTIMSNPNVAAVAQLADVSCVVLAEGVVPDEKLVERASAEDIVIMKTPFSSYEACWKIHEADV